MSTPKVSEEEIQEAAYFSCEQLFITLKKRGASIAHDDALIDEVVIETVLHHREHLRVHEVEQRHVDAYKIVSWLGCILLKKLLQTQKKDSMEPVDSGLQFDMVAGALVDLLGGFFYEDKDIHLPDEMLEFLIKMLHEEAYNNGDHGIWMNGLYMAFHSAVVVAELHPTAESE